MPSAHTLAAWSLCNLHPAIVLSILEGLHSQHQPPPPSACRPQPSALQGLSLTTDQLLDRAGHMQIWKHRLVHAWTNLVQFDLCRLPNGRSPHLRPIPCAGCGCTYGGPGS